MLALSIFGSRQMSHKQPGLNGRHRDANGQISHKHGNTLVGSLRQTYGDSFAPRVRSDAKLSTVLQNNGVSSLSSYLKQK